MYLHRKQTQWKQQLALATERCFSIPKVTILTVNNFSHLVFPRVVSLLLLIMSLSCSLFHFCTLSLCVTHLLALSSLIHQRGWGFARAVWRKDVTQWDCGIVTCLQKPLHMNAALFHAVYQNKLKTHTHTSSSLCFSRASRAARQHKSHQCEKTLRVFFSPAVKCKAIKCKSQLQAHTHTRFSAYLLCTVRPSHNYALEVS